MPIVRQTNLAYRGGGSDKVYHVTLEQSRNSLTAYNFSVDARYGRRGNALQRASKGTFVSLARAEQAFTKLVREKTAKGYRVVSETGGAATLTINGDSVGLVSNVRVEVATKKAFGHHPQLLNPLDPAKREEYLKSNDWWMQEKKDGRNFLISKKGSVVTAGNRKGEVVDCPPNVLESIQKLDGDFIVSGELCGSGYFMFDILELDSENLRDKPYYYRFNQLDLIFNQIEDKSLPYLDVVETTASYSTKKAEYDALKAAGAEGVVFKRKDAVFTAGRPNSGGDQVKDKFVQMATCKVSPKITGKRSVGIQLRHADGYKDVGNVTILPNFEIPDAGALIEVEYLYAYPEGSLYQPVYKGERDDKDDADDASSVKFKQVAEGEDDA